ncbi:hypothetical protein [Aquabacterium sp.]|uniref:hypothetical protein n=1 Tax=Aquabacterium sp. TaxID=1872578 RepID=UPI002606A20B|nr:hypothetical protein [Aquabacterium sp.]MDD2978307.1 hypothetical protein [Aquabacterium sp.]
MNHEKEYSKTAAAGCEVRRIKSLSTEGHFLPESALKEISRVPHTLMIVSARGEKSIIKGVQVAVGKAGRRYVADKITGTLYDPETSRSLSGARTLEGPAPEGYKLPPKGEAYRFGTQPITNSPKKRGRPQKQGTERNADGNVCGSSKHSAKINEDAVRAIRAHKPGSTCIYAITAKQAAQLFGISEKTVSEIRQRRTWGHVA